MEKLWYQKPAMFWRQALPIGNGVCGVMIYGGKRHERLSFNDGTLYSGYPKNQDNPESLKNLETVRNLIFSGKNKDADELTKTKLIGAYCESFVPLGDLNLKFSNKQFNGYSRELDLKSAIHKVEFNGQKRIAFSSYPHKVTVYRIESEKKFNVELTAKSKLKSEVIIDGALNLVGNAPDYVAPNYLMMEKHPIKYDKGKGMSFCLRTEVDTDGSMTYFRDRIIIKNATIINLYCVTATGFISYNQDPITDRKYVTNKCKTALLDLDKDYDKIINSHIIDYQQIYNKHSFSLKEESDLDTFNLVKLAKGGEVKKGLVELFYNYGKYMTIAGSRNGGQALNLQGIWNKSVRPPWSSNYTANINAQMNYWGATRSNLSECMGPFVELVYEIMEAGKSTAKVNYGCGGFACNHNVDIWRKTAPVQGNPSYMYSPLCGAWLANELFEHYKGGKLNAYKEKIVEIVKTSAQFLNDYLVLHDGFYVTCPSASPEAEFYSSGKRCSLDYASAYEMGIVKQGFSNYLEIDSSSEFSLEIVDKLSKLFPFKEGSTGILEWHDDYKITEAGHRHFSPLYAFYPARIIKYHENEKETTWVKKLFEYRINNSTSFIGWSAAWAICLAGRLHDGEKALKVIESMLGHSVFYNLFDVHPPFLFQIDGNMGFISGINEMLVYVENGVIDLLPALPKEWSFGEMKGVIINGSEISFKWEEGKITEIISDKIININELNLSQNCKMSNVNVIPKSYDKFK